MTYCATECSRFYYNRGGSRRGEVGFQLMLCEKGDSVHAPTLSGLLPVCEYYGMCLSLLRNFPIACFRERKRLETTFQRRTWLKVLTSTKYTRIHIIIIIGLNIVCVDVYLQALPSKNALSTSMCCVELVLP